MVISKAARVPLLWLQRPKDTNEAIRVLPQLLHRFPLARILPNPQAVLQQADTAILRAADGALTAAAMI